MPRGLEDENRMRKRMCFLSTKACKPILVVAQNKIMNLKMSMFPLIVKFQNTRWVNV